MENKLTQIRTNQQPSMRLGQSQQSIEEWLAEQLGYLAILLDRPWTPERLDAYVQELRTYPRWKLQIAFRRLKTEWKAKDFGFPLVGDFIERMTPEYSDGTPEPIEYKQPQLAAGVIADDMTPEEKKTWWQSVKQQVAMIGLRKRDAQKPVKESAQSREMTDLEIDQRLNLLKKQAQEAKSRFE